MNTYIHTYIYTSHSQSEAKLRRNWKQVLITTFSHQRIKIFFFFFSPVFYDCSDNRPIRTVFTSCVSVMAAKSVANMSFSLILAIRVRDTEYKFFFLC